MTVSAGQAAAAAVGVYNTVVGFNYLIIAYSILLMCRLVVSASDLMSAVHGHQERRFRSRSDGGGGGAVDGAGRVMATALAAVERHDVH